MALGDCISAGRNRLSDAFTDTSGLSVQYDNFGVAKVSFSILHKSGMLQGGEVSFVINGRRFTGTIDSILPSDLEGADYTESRVTFIGFGC